MLRKNVKSLLEQLQVCIFAEIVFGVRCTLRTGKRNSIDFDLRKKYHIMPYICIIPFFLGAFALLGEFPCSQKKKS